MPAASLVSLPIMPTNTTRGTACSTALRSAAPVKSPTSTKQTSGRPGSNAIAPFSVRPPVHSTSGGSGACVLSACAPRTATACSTDARHDAVEKGRTMPVVPRIEMPPRMPSRRLVVLRAITSPPGTEITTRSMRSSAAGPRLSSAASSASLTARSIIARGTGLIAGPPISRPRPGLVTTPTPSPPSSCIAPPARLIALAFCAATPAPATPLAPSRQETVAVRCAPWVTSGSSPASLTTTACHVPGLSSSQRSTGNVMRCAHRPSLPGNETSTRAAGSPDTRAHVAAFAAAAEQVPVVQPLRSAFPPRVFMVRGRSGSRSSLTSGPYFGSADVACRVSPLAVSAAVPVKVPGVVEVRAGAVRAESRADQEQRVLPQLARLDRFLHGGHGAVRQFLVWPGGAGRDEYRRVRGVPSGQQLCGELTGARGGEENGHRRAVGGERADRLARRHRGLAAFEPGQDDRLRHLWDRQLALGEGGDGGEGRDAGHDLHLEAKLARAVKLFLDGSPQRGIAGVHPRDAQPFGGGLLVVRQHAFDRQRGRVDDLGAGPSVLQDFLLDETGGPD